MRLKQGMCDMEDFKVRAKAWAEKNGDVFVDCKHNIFFGAVQYHSCYWSYNCTADSYLVKGRPLTEVIIEWEDRMKNKMPELKAGMVVVYGDRHNNGTVHYGLMIDNDQAVTVDGYRWSKNMSTRTDVLEVYDKISKCPLCQYESEIKIRTPIWKKKDTAEIEAEIVKFTKICEETIQKIFDLKKEL